MAEPVELDQVAQALNLGPHEHIALVGGGGKSTLLHALGHQLSGSRILTTTTKMGHDQHEGLEVLIAPSPEEAIAAAQSAPVMIWSGTEDQKAFGVEPQECDRWFTGVDYVIIEADGARRLPFKAPSAYEPIVPSSATLMLSVIGSDALGETINEMCHRPKKVAELADCSPYQELTPERAARVLAHSNGAVREKPEDARFVVVITKVNEQRLAAANELASELQKRSVKFLIIITKQG